MGRPSGGHSTALKRIDLQSTAWEYAFEMVLKASLLELKMTEILIKF
jgi:hypothetical protein